MSPGERQHLRAVIDERRRGTIHRAPFAGPRVPGSCDYCGGELPRASPSNAARLRFCSDVHRANWWRVGRGRLDWEARIAALDEAVA